MGFLSPYSPLSQGFYAKVIPPEAAEYVAKYWSPGNVEFPLEHKTKYIEDIITHFDLLGVYSVDNHKYPVAWVGEKPGT